MTEWTKYDNLLKSLTEAKEVLTPEEIARLIHRVFSGGSQKIKEELSRIMNSTNI